MMSNKFIERGQCALCGSSNKSMYIDFPDIPIVRCQDCGFIYSSKILSEEDTYQYYSNIFGSYRHLQGQMVNATINAWVISRLMDMNEIRYVLDVGTGYGFLLNSLKKRFHMEVTGVELSHQEAQYALNTLDLNVINAPLALSGLKQGVYDLVTSFEVVEHIAFPLEFIKEMAQYVKVGGYLLIMTDNFTSRMALSLGAGFPKWIPHTHVSHFSPITLKTAIEKSENLKVIASISYTPWEVFLRDIYYKLYRINKLPSETYNLEGILKTEMNKKYKLFQLRKLFNKFWVQQTLNKNMDGDMMYFLAKKIS